MVCLEQGQSYLPENQSSLEDRYYNNQSFQEDFPINDPEVNQAATKIQAKFRGHKARQNVEKLKQETRTTVDTDQQDLGYPRDQSATPNEEENETQLTFEQPEDHYQQQEEQKAHVKSPSPKTSPRLPDATDEPKKDDDEIQYVVEPDEEFTQELTEEEKEEQERAARSIQARFRGFKARQSAGQTSSSMSQHSGRDENQEFDQNKTSAPSSARPSEKLDTDRQDDEGNLFGDDQNEMGENDESDRPRFERESTKLSEDFERHTQIPRDSDFAREQQPDGDDDMDDSQRDKAAIRIQASFRGYKTRKELNSTGSLDSPQQPPTVTSPHPHDEDDQDQRKVASPPAEASKEPEGEEDDNAAATKIQAAFRGYRTRKELEK